MGLTSLLLDPKSGMNRSCAFFAFIISIWAFGDTFYYASTDKAWGWFWFKFTSIGWGGMIFAIFYICAEFSGYYKRIPLVVKAGFFVYSIVIIILQYNSTLFLKDFNHTNIGLIETVDYTSPGFYLLYGGITVAAIVGICIIIRKIFETKFNREKGMLKIFLILSFMNGILGMGLNNLQVFFRKPVPPLGSVFMLVFISGLLFLMRKYRILRIDYRMLQNETFDILSDFIFIISPEMKIININNTAKNNIIAVGDDIFSIFADKEEFKRHYAESVSAEINKDRKYMLIKGKNGKNIPAHILIRHVFDNFKDHIGAILIASPLTEFEKIANEYNITQQERRVIAYLVEGLLNKEISSKMNISESTVKNHITNIYQKTNTANKVELLRLFFLHEV
jgi:DNA-binding CsgD family transcriptional regulator